LTDGQNEEVSISFKELDCGARAIAAWLSQRVRTSDRVLLVYPPGIEYITAFYGCLYMGAVAVPMYPPRRNQNSLRLQSVVSDSQPAIALTSEPILKRVDLLLNQTPELLNIGWLSTDRVDHGAYSDWQEPEISRDALAFLQYTSGSTAAPKGVMVSHENLLYNSRMIHTAFEHEESSVIVTWLPLYHDMGLIGNIIQSLYAGARCIFMSPATFVQKPLRWLQAISKYRAHTSGGPNFAYELCARKVTPEKTEGLDLSSWRVAFNGSEPVRHDTLERFAAAFEPCGFRPEAFYPCYGLAEATLFVSGGLKSTAPICQRLDVAALEHDGLASPSSSIEKTRNVVGCGASRLDQRIVIVDPELFTRCAPGEIGEIWVSGPNITRGYWRKPEETEYTFSAYLADTGEGPFLRTGDLGFFIAGELFIASRLKDLIVIDGCNHYPQDIEQTVEYSHDSVRTGCVAAFSVDADSEERLVVVAEVDNSSRARSRASTGKDFLPADSESVIYAIRRLIAEHNDLQVYDVVLLKPGAIPKTSSGKIMRRACRTEYLAGKLAASAVADPQPFSSRLGPNQI
jgi:acyl-CoA synthetase (AMP-forming)/AMP-acid ligase II